MPKTFEIFVVLWLLIGMGVAATLMFFCVGNIGAGLARVAKNTFDYVLLSILVVLIFAWAVVTGPIWVLIVAIANTEEGGIDA